MSSDGGHKCGRSSGSSTNCSTTPKSWSRNNIGRQGLIDVDQDTWVGWGVEFFTSSTSGIGGTASSDLQVDALRVVLGSVCVLGRVKSDDFVAQDIVSRCDSGRDFYSPAVVGGDELVGSPCSWDGVVVDQTTFLYLDKVQLCLVHGRAVAIAVGEIADNGTVVASGPCSPLELDSASCGNWSRNRTGYGIPVADDVCTGVLSGIDESQVCCSGCPPNDSWRVGLVRELVHEISRVADLVVSMLLASWLKVISTYDLPPITMFCTKPWPATVEARARTAERAATFVEGILSTRFC